MPLHAISVAVCRWVPAPEEYPVMPGVLVPSEHSYLKLNLCGMEAGEEEGSLRAEARLCCFLTSVALGPSYFLAYNNIHLSMGNQGAHWDVGWNLTYISNLSVLNSFIWLNMQSLPELKFLVMPFNDGNRKTGWKSSSQRPYFSDFWQPRCLQSGNRKPKADGSQKVNYFHSTMKSQPSSVQLLAYLAKPSLPSWRFSLFFSPAIPVVSFVTKIPRFPCLPVLFSQLVVLRLARGSWLKCRNSSTSSKIN